MDRAAVDTSDVDFVIDDGTISPRSLTSSPRKNRQASPTSRLRTFTAFAAPNTDTVNDKQKYSRELSPRSPSRRQSLQVKLVSTNTNIASECKSRSPPQSPRSSTSLTSRRQSLQVKLVSTNTDIASECKSRSPPQSPRSSTSPKNKPSRRPFRPPPITTQNEFNADSLPFFERDETTSLTEGDVDNIMSLESVLLAPRLNTNRPEFVLFFLHENAECAGRNAIAQMALHTLLAAHVTFKVLASQLISAQQERINKKRRSNPVQIVSIRAQGLPIDTEVYVTVRRTDIPVEEAWASLPETQEAIQTKTVNSQSGLCAWTDVLRVPWDEDGVPPLLLFEVFEGLRLLGSGRITLDPYMLFEHQDIRIPLGSEESASSPCLFVKFEYVGIKSRSRLTLDMAAALSEGRVRRVMAETERNVTDGGDVARASYGSVWCIKVSDLRAEALRTPTGAGIFKPTWVVLSNSRTEAVTTGGQKNDICLWKNLDSFRIFWNGAGDIPKLEFYVVQGEIGDDDVELVGIGQLSVECYTMLYERGAEQTIELRKPALVSPRSFNRKIRDMFHGSSKMRSPKASSSSGLRNNPNEMTSPRDTIPPPIAIDPIGIHDALMADSTFAGRLMVRLEYNGVISEEAMRQSASRVEAVRMRITEDIEERRMAAEREILRRVEAVEEKKRFEAEQDIARGLAMEIAQKRWEELMLVKAVDETMRILAVCEHNEGWERHKIASEEMQVRIAQEVVDGNRSGSGLVRMILSHRVYCECGDIAVTVCKECFDHPRLCFNCFNLFHYMTVHTPDVLYPRDFLPTENLLLNILTRPGFSGSKNAPKPGLQITLLSRAEGRVRKILRTEETDRFFEWTQLEVMQRQRLSHRHKPQGRVRDVLQRVRARRAGLWEILCREELERDAWYELELVYFHQILEQMYDDGAAILLTEQYRNFRSLEDLAEMEIRPMCNPIELHRRVRAVQYNAQSKEKKGWMFQWYLLGLIYMCTSNLTQIHIAFGFQLTSQLFSSLCITQESLLRTFILQNETDGRVRIRKLCNEMTPVAQMVSTVVQLNVDRFEFCRSEVRARCEVVHTYLSGLLQSLRRMETRTRKCLEKMFLADLMKLSYNTLRTSVTWDWSSATLLLPELAQDLSYALSRIDVVTTGPLPSISLPEDLNDFDFSNSSTDFPEVPNEEEDIEPALLPAGAPPDMAYSDLYDKVFHDELLRCWEERGNAIKGSHTPRIRKKKQKPAVDLSLFKRPNPGTRRVVAKKTDEDSMPMTFDIGGRKSSSQRSTLTAAERMQSLKCYQGLRSSHQNRVRDLFERKGLHRDAAQELFQTPND